MDFPGCAIQGTRDISIIWKGKEEGVKDSLLLHNIKTVNIMKYIIQTKKYILIFQYLQPAHTYIYIFMRALLPILFEQAQPVLRRLSKLHRVHNPDPRPKRRADEYPIPPPSRAIFFL
jgi:hypothetical protein